MICGQIICVIGAGLITRIGVDTKVEEWAGYLVITGIGMGMSMQLPYTIVQVTLEYVPQTPFPFLPGSSLQNLLSTDRSPSQRNRRSHRQRYLPPFRATS